jgi:SAM-dependent methyltransferase|tara:strand:- start:11209 stop:12075 length:867 start_codon:yes stop_codon:yes gene_type:complete
MRHNLKSSSNSISGDVSTTFAQTMLYSLNFLRELVFSNKEKNEESFEIIEDDLYVFWGTKDWTKFSPARIACDGFLINYLKNNFSNEMPINILDVGCGKGHYSTMIRNLGYQVKYTGIDITPREEWSELEDRNTRFLSLALGEDRLRENVPKIGNNIDLIFSQSCLEHIENDISALIELTTEFPNSKQIHLIPGVISFLNYFKHGFRRYSQRNFTHIANYLNVNYQLKAIGGHEMVRSYFPFFYKNYKRRHKFDFFGLYKMPISLKSIIKGSKTTRGQYPVFYSLEIT